MAVVNSRENTFKVDLSCFPKRPSYESIHSFVHRTIGLQIHEVKRLQVNHALKCAHVKCVDLPTALDTVNKHDGRHELEVEGIRFRVRLAIDVGCIEVKIHDLSEKITNEEIASFLRQYGDVHDVRELLWSNNFDLKGVPSGVRVATMTLQRHIKSFLTYRGQPTLITYKGQPQTCRHCTQLLHPGSTCAENKKLLKSIAKHEGNNASSVCGTQSETTTNDETATSNETNTSSSFASALKNASSSTQVTKPQKPINKTDKSQSNCSGNGLHSNKRKSQQQQQRQQQTKQPVNQSSSTLATSPPRKKKDTTKKETAPLIPSGSPVEAEIMEITTDDTDTVQDVSDDPEPNSEEDLMKWIKWVEKKCKIVKQ